MIVAKPDWTGFAPPDRTWSAYDDDLYDGAPDSPTRSLIGFGRTREEAIEDLRRLTEERMESR